jgi:hypothetical protein
MEANLYLMSTEDPKEGLKAPPFGPAFTQEQVDQSDKMQTYGTTFSHPEEFTEFRLIKNNETIFTKRVDGY